jgi:hypothetical protein
MFLTTVMISSGRARDLDVDRVDVGEALEEHALALHHRLGGQRAQVAQTQDGGAVGDHGHQIALGGVVVGEVMGIAGDRQHRHGHARRIGQRQVALRRHRLGRHHGDLAGRGSRWNASASSSVKVRSLGVAHAKLTTGESATPRQAQRFPWARRQR